MKGYTNVQLIWDYDRSCLLAAECIGWYVRYDEIDGQSHLDEGLTASDQDDPGTAEAEARTFLGGYTGPIDFVR